MWRLDIQVLTQSHTNDDAITYRVRVVRLLGDKERFPRELVASRVLAFCDPAWWGTLELRAPKGVGSSR